MDNTHGGGALGKKWANEVNRRDGTIQNNLDLLSFILRPPEGDSSGTASQKSLQLCCYVPSRSGQQARGCGLNMNRQESY